MSEMVEKVAAAIWSAHTGSSVFHEDTYRHDEKEREWWRFVARAAIEAMREPTREMLKAGEAGINSLPALPDHYAEYCWPAMIEAALSPSGEK